MAMTPAVRCAQEAAIAQGARRAGQIDPKRALKRCRSQSLVSGCQRERRWVRTSGQGGHPPIDGHTATCRKRYIAVEGGTRPLRQLRPFVVGAPISGPDPSRSYGGCSVDYGCGHSRTVGTDRLAPIPVIRPARSAPLNAPFACALRFSGLSSRIRIG